MSKEVAKVGHCYLVVVHEFACIHDGVASGDGVG